MLRLILLTIVGLFGVLAIYGTPEMAGGSTIATDQPAAVPEVLQQASLTLPVAPAPSVKTPADLLAAAMSGPGISEPAVTGPRLQPSPEHAAHVTAASELKTGALYVSGSKVNLRAAPDASSAVLASLAVGTAVRPVGSASDAWVEVEAGTQRGFVSARYLSPRSPG